MKSPLARAVVLALVPLPFGCIDLSLPPGVTVVCDPADEASCPSGTACQPGLLVCVETEALDTRAPVVEVTVTPQLGRLGALVTAHVVLDEPAAEPPAVALDVADGDVRSFVLDGSASVPGDQDFTLVYTPRGDEPTDRDIVVRASASDRVGLLGEAEASVRFDFTAPEPIPTDSRVDARGAAVLVVAPGGDVGADEPVRRVEVPAGVLADGEALLLRTEPTAAPFEVVAARADGSARANVALSTVELWVAARDAAGNEGEPVRIREVRFIQTTAPLFDALPAMGGELLPKADLGPLTRGRVPTFRGAELRGPMTAARIDLDTPPAMSSAAMIYDPARAELLLIGALPGGDDGVADAWAWNGDGWVPRVLGAPPRRGHALAYNPTDASITLVAGSLDNPFTDGENDTWRKDDSTFVLEEADARSHFDTQSYELRCSSFGAAFDPTRPGTLVVHGCKTGGAQNVPYAQWERGPDGVWQVLLEPADPEGDGNPKVLRAGCMVADETRKRLVLFGGNDDTLVDGAHDGTTWEWDGTTWVLAHAADPTGVTAPRPRMTHFCAWDPVTGRTLVGGGYSRIGEEPAEYMTDLWAWDGVAWTRLADFPGEQRLHAAAGVYAPTGELIVFGADNFAGASRDTLVFDGATWRTVAARTGGPAGRASPSLAALDGALYMHGGFGEGADTDLWRLVDGRWTSLGPFTNPSSYVPSGRLTARAGELLYAGGIDSGETATDILRLTPAGTTVDTSLLTPFPAPSTGWNEFSIAVDPATGIVAFGGGFRHVGAPDPVSERSLWFFDGATWTEGPPVGPPDASMQRPGVVWDEAGGGILLVGVNTELSTGGTAFLPFDGIGNLGSTSWQPLAADAERPRSLAGPLVYDPTLQAPVLLGGPDGGSIKEAYVWRANAWVTVPILDAESDGLLPPVSQPAGAFDDATGRIVIFGGSADGSVPTARTFAVDTLGADRPALLVQPDPASGGFVDPEAVLGLTLVVDAGASASGVDGFTVRVWDRFHWIDVAESDVAALPFDQLPRTTLTVGPAPLQNALLRGRVPIQLVPRGENGADRARMIALRVEASVLLRMK